MADFLFVYRGGDMPKNASPEQMQQAVALIDSARRAGIDITADQYPYTASGTGLAAMLNTWVQEGGSDSLVARLKDPAVRARLKKELGEDSATGIRTAERTMVNTVGVDSLKKYQGKRLTEIAKMRGGGDARRANPSVRRLRGHLHRAQRL